MARCKALFVTATSLMFVWAGSFPCAYGQSTELPGILDAHNEVRANYGAPFLSWDSKLEQDAWSWAEYLSSGCSISHSGDPDNGENIYMCSASGEGGCATGTSSRMAVDDPLAGWYESEKTWSPLAPSHFTQVVWKSSQRVGCGVARCSPGGTATSEIVVCKYNPPGNVAGQYEENVSTAAGNNGSGM